MTLSSVLPVATDQMPTSVETPRARLIFFAVIGAALSLGLLAYYIHGLHGSLPFPQDGVGYVLGRDFLNTWFYGKAAFLADPGRFYDHDTYARWIDAVVPQDIFNHLWSYPPHFLLFAAPLGLLGYPWALAAWSLAGVLALYLAVRGMALRTAAILMAPATLFCLFGGQISLFMAACALGALHRLDRRPWLAGFLIALTTVKPQTALLFPVLLIASRRWSVLAAAAIGTVLLVALTTALFGIQVWLDYARIGLPTQLADTRATYGVLAPFSPTITTAVLLAGGSQSLASVVQMSFLVAAAALVALVCARGPMDARRCALFLAASVFAAPYLLIHDLTAVTAATLFVAAEPLDRNGTWLVKGMVLLPMLQLATGIAHLPGAALVPVTFAVWAARSLLTPKTNVLAAPPSLA